MSESAVVDSGTEDGRRGPSWLWLFVGLILGSVATEGVRRLADRHPRESPVSPAQEALEAGRGAASRGSTGLPQALAQRPPSRPRRVQQATVAENSEVLELREELRRLHARLDSERAQRLTTSFGELEDVLAEPELNPDGKRLSPDRKRMLRDALLALNKRRSIAQDRLNTLYHEEGLRRLERGEGLEQDGSLPAEVPDGGRRLFMTQFGPDGPVSRVVDVYPGENPVVDEAAAELELLVLEGREELRLLIAQS